MYAHAHLSSSVIMTSWPLCDPGMLMLSPIKRFVIFEKRREATILEENLWERDCKIIELTLLYFFLPNIRIVRCIKVSRYSWRLEFWKIKRTNLIDYVFTRKSTRALYDIYKKIQTREIPFWLRTFAPYCNAVAMYYTHRVSIYQHQRYSSIICSIYAPTRTIHRVIHRVIH